MDIKHQDHRRRRRKLELNVETDLDDHRNSVGKKRGDHTALSEACHPEAGASAGRKALLRGTELGVDREPVADIDANVTKPDLAHRQGHQGKHPALELFELRL